MTSLFTQYWDVIPGRFDDYSAFVSKEYIPAMERLGLKLLGGFYVAVGQGPRIIVVGTVEEQDYLRRILSTEEYRIIMEGLSQFVCKYSSKLYVSSGRLAQGPYHIQTGAWKFNQYYNLVPGKEMEHYHFVKDECIPGMKELGVPVVGAWRMVIGEGPKILAECASRDMAGIARCIDSSLFRKLVRRLKKHFATDYGSRILAPTGRIEIPSLIENMMKGF
ncbi:MAG: hypothetical protein M1511_15705 [Deltaproteobacteria bacterium]|nr:hypothetical protein [Deltaproteobacteria bacterium]